MTQQRSAYAREPAHARNRELAQIHIGVAALRWTEDDYRSILFAKTGKYSAAELDGTGRRRFIDHLKACGWKGATNTGPRLSKQQYHVKMLWKDLGSAGALDDASEAALDRFIANTVGMSSLRFLTSTHQASQVIEALKSWLLRVGRAAT